MTNPKPDLAAIKARAEKVPEGQWHDDGHYFIHDPNEVTVAAIRPSDNSELICEVRYPEHQDKAAIIEFIAHSRTDIDDLLEALEAAEVEAGRLRVALGQYVRHELNCGDVWRRLDEPRRCDCGLDKALRGE